MFIPGLQWVEIEENREDLSQVKKGNSYKCMVNHTYPSGLFPLYTTRLPECDFMGIMLLKSLKGRSQRTLPLRKTRQYMY